MPSDVPDDVVATFLSVAARHALEHRLRSSIHTDTLRAAIAAVEPLIRAAEREECAKWHDKQAAGEDALAEHALGADHDAWMHHRHTAATHRASAAAIRARGSEDNSVAPPPG